MFSFQWRMGSNSIAAGTGAVEQIIGTTVFFYFFPYPFISVSKVE